MNEIKIFIASSAELKSERLLFSMLANNINILLKSKKIKVYLEKWEYLDASMGPLHKQQEYNDVLANCDMCLAIFWTKFGDYTKEELDTAQKECGANNILKNVHIYCKDDFNISAISQELKMFKQACMLQGVPIYTFMSDEQLTYHFIMHIDAYCQENFGIAIARIEDNKLMIEHKSFANLSSIPLNEGEEVL